LNACSKIEKFLAESLDSVPLRGVELKLEAAQNLKVDSTIGVPSRSFSAIIGD
jgi:hypothetical protein